MKFREGRAHVKCGEGKQSTKSIGTRSPKTTVINAGKSEHFALIMLHTIISKSVHHIRYGRKTIYASHNKRSLRANLANGKRVQTQFYVSNSVN